MMDRYDVNDCRGPSIVRSLLEQTASEQTVCCSEEECDVVWTGFPTGSVVWTGSLTGSVVDCVSVYDVSDWCVVFDGLH